MNSLRKIVWAIGTDIASEKSKMVAACRGRLQCNGQNIQGDREAVGYLQDGQGSLYTPVRDDMWQLTCVSPGGKYNHRITLHYLQLGQKFRCSSFSCLSYMYRKLLCDTQIFPQYAVYAPNTHARNVRTCYRFLLSKCFYNDFLVLISNRKRFGKCWVTI